MSNTVTLGSRKFQLRPLKLGQLRELLDALDEMSGKSAGALVEAAARVVAAGLAPAHPDLTPETILDLEAGVDELNAAVAAVLQVAGLRAREPQEGEARPVASPGQTRGSSSAPSTAPLPPAAATTTA